MTAGAPPPTWTPGRIVPEVAACLRTRFRATVPPEVRYDIVQETLLRLLQQETWPDNPDSWAMTVAQHLAISWLRRAATAAQAQRELQERARVDEDLWERSTTARLDLQRAAVSMRMAPDRYRRLLVSHCLEGDPLEELIALELQERGERPDDSTAYDLARDAIYKRRARATAWVRASLGAA